MYCRRSPTGLDHQRKTCLLHIQLVAHRILILRILDRRTFPYVDCSKGIHRNVVDTFDLRSTGGPSRGSCWDYIVDDGVVESVLRVQEWEPYSLMGLGWIHRIGLGWFVYRH